MTQAQRIAAFINAVGTDIKGLNTFIGNLTNLNTTTKVNLVAAINEIQAALATSGGSAVINDAASSGTTLTYSIDKIKAVVAQAKIDILGGVPQAAYDTLVEIANYISSDATATTGLINSIGKRVAVDSAQSFSSGEQAQARANIGALSTVEIGNPDIDLVVLYSNAKI